MRYETVIFDLDGTLLETREDMAVAVNHALGEAGLPELEQPVVVSYIGNGIRNLMLKSVYGPDPDPGYRAGTPVSAEAFEEILEEFRSYYSEHINIKTAPYEGVAELVGALKEAGCRMGIVSNKFDAAVKELNRMHFGDAIEIAYGQREDVPKKPDPAAIHEVMEELGAEAEKTVYIGDSEVDIRTAANAGIDCIICPWGFRSREELEAAGAPRIVDSAREIAQICTSDR